MVRLGHDKEKIKTCLSVTAAIICVGLGVASSCLQGLFFLDRAAVLFLMSGGIGLTALVLGFWEEVRKQNGGSSPHSSYHQEQPLLYWAGCQQVILVGPFIIALLHVCHLPSFLSFQAVQEAVLFWTFAGCFGLGLNFAGRSSRGRGLITAGWHVLGLVLGLSGLATVVGLLAWPGAVLHSSDSEVAAFGARLGGLLQYPNTFGAVMAVFLVERLAFSGREGKYHVLSTALAWGYTVCLFLSESRGAWLAALIGAGVSFCQLKGIQRLGYLLRGIVMLSCGWAAAVPIVHARLAPATYPALLLLTVAMLSSVILSLGIDRLTAYFAVRFAKSKALNERSLVCKTLLRKSSLGVVITLVIVVAMLSIPISTYIGRSRLVSADTWQSRMAMYRDGWNLFLTSPWNGFGAEAWPILFRSIQQYPYVGAEVHSGYLNILLELGIVGAIVFLVWLGAAIWKLNISGSYKLAPLLVLLTHAVIDFDMSYGLFWLLILWLVVPDKAVVNRSGTRVGQRIRDSLILLGLLALIVVSTWGCAQAASQTSYHLARNALKAGNEAKGIRLLERALALNPAHLPARLQLAELSDPIRTVNILKEGLLYETQHAGLWLRIGNVRMNNQLEEAIRAWDVSIGLDPFNSDNQTLVLRNVAFTAQTYLATEQWEKAAQAISFGCLHYRQYKLLAERQAQQNHYNDRRFTLTEEAIRWRRELERLMLYLR